MLHSKTLDPLLLLALDTHCLLPSICSVLHSKERNVEHREEGYTAQEGSDGLPGLRRDGKSRPRRTALPVSLAEALYRSSRHSIERDRRNEAQGTSGKHPHGAGATGR
jgi:hypothetical protein